VVREESRGLYDRRGKSDLVFYNDDIMRRIRDYPENWLDLPDDELYALSLKIAKNPS
jgi:hypothetical protein